MKARSHEAMKRRRRDVGGTGKLAGRNSNSIAVLRLLSVGANRFVGFVTWWFNSSPYGFT